MTVVQNIEKFVKSLAKDDRGDMSYADKTVHLSTAAKVVIGAVAITGAAAGVTSVTNNSNSASDKTSSQINSANGSSTEPSGKQTAPFKGATQ